MLPLKSIIADKLVMIVAPQSKAWVDGVKKCDPRDTLVFDRADVVGTEQRAGYLARKFQKLSDIAKTNCEVAILDPWSSLILNSKRYFWRTRLTTLLVPKGASSLLYLGGLKYYQRSGRLSVAGETELGSGSSRRVFQVIKVHRGDGVNNRLLFAPHEWKPRQVLAHMRGLNYVLLRAVEDIETEANFKDIDVLVSDDDLPELKRRFSQQIGLFPFDVYAETGINGHDYQSVPYFFPRFARQILTDAEVRGSGIRAPSKRHRYLSLSYHLLFHGKSRHLAKDTILSEETFPKPQHYQALMAAARDAGFRPPRSFDDIDADLKANDAFPSTDILGFYGRRNKFVVERYLSDQPALRGLVVFFVRDFDDPLSVIGDVERVLTRNLQILAQGPVDDANRSVIQERVRGGNWRDNSNASLGKPLHWFVCWDPNPIKVDRKLRKKYPHLDNARIATIKLGLRELADGKRIVHASDNASEALEHIRVLGLDGDPRVVRLMDNRVPERTTELALGS